jgi:hypothetical protein
MATLTEVQRAYLAGIIDGEGCFNIYRSGKRPRVDYALRVHVMTTSKELAVWLSANIGGSIHSRESKHGWKTRYEWFFDRSVIDELIKTIRPYLVIKPKQADLALRFRESFATRTAPLTPNVRALREDCYQAMKRLNQKGIAKPSPL